MDEEFERLLKKPVAPVMDHFLGNGRFRSAHRLQKYQVQLPTLELIASARREGRRRAEEIEVGRLLKYFPGAHEEKLSTS